jgi:hypothetical protein
MSRSLKTDIPLNQTQFRDTGEEYKEREKKVCDFGAQIKTESRSLANFRDMLKK